MKVKSAIMKRLQNPVVEINAASHVMCVTLYSQSLNSFITMAFDNFKMLVSCASRLGDISGVYSDLDPIATTFPSVSTWHFEQVS
jgi:hypothetical protein